MTPFLILMMEAEQPEGLSSRKLVVETAKHNVITAYNGKDGLALFRRVPDVDAVLVHAALLKDENLIGAIREMDASIPIIVVTPETSQTYRGADYVLSSRSPRDLLDLLASKIPPRGP